MSSTKNILIVGATGQVGSQTVASLRDRANLRLFAATRSPEKAAALTNGNVTGIVLDLDSTDSIRKAVEGIDVALLMTGYTADMIRQSKRFLDLAKTAGVGHIVHIGASGAETNEVAHWTWHRLVETYIEQLGFAYTHLRPESFMQNIFNFGWLQGDTLHDFIGNAPWSWVDTEDVAHVVTAVLADPGRFDGQVIPLGYDVQSITDVAATIQQVAGREITVESHSPEDFRTLTYQGTKESVYADAYMKCVADQFTLDANRALPAGRVYDNFTAITGRQPTDWAAFVAKHRARITA